MGLNSCRRADSLSGDQEFACLLWNCNFARTVHWIISWCIWIKFHTITLCFLKISCIIILLTTL